MNYLPFLKPGIDRLRFWLVVGGVPGVLGAAFLAAAAVGQFLLLPRIEQSAAMARATAAREHKTYLKAAEAARGGAPDATESLARFRATLTSEKSAGKAFEIIQRNAKKHGFVPDGTEYKWQRQADARLAEVRIVMSLKGGYGALRSFVRDVLTDVPGLALEQFDLQRESVGAAGTEAHLRFALFLGIEP
jgi:hypothetical protein